VTFSVAQHFEKGKVELGVCSKVAAGACNVCCLAPDVDLLC